MAKLVIAIWEPDAAVVDRRRGPGVVVRQALENQGRYGAGEPFDVLVTARIEDPAGLGPGDLGDLGERVWAWAVDERRPRAGTETCAVTMVALMRRAPALTAEQFAAHWTARHTPLALAHHAGLHDYTQNLVVESLTTGADEVDGVAELGFRTRAAFETEFYDSDDGRRVINEDVRRFMAGPGPDTTLLAPPT